LKRAFPCNLDHVVRFRKANSKKKKNECHAIPMHKDSDGVRHLSVELEPGRHEYRFVADVAWKNDPSAQQRAPNGMGSENCVKTVPG
jgi:hypothetical protein